MNAIELKGRLMKLPKAAIIDGFLAACFSDPAETYIEALRALFEVEHRLALDALTRAIRCNGEAASSQSVDDAESADAAYKEYLAHSKRAQRWHEQIMDSYRL